MQKYVKKTSDIYSILYKNITKEQLVGNYFKVMISLSDAEVKLLSLGMCLLMEFCRQLSVTKRLDR